MNRVFSGVQPTGNLHLGNYLGAIQRFVQLQDSHECLFCIVDLHAITVWQNPETLRQNIREVTAAFIACGIDPNKHIIFNQSQVPYHTEMAWLLNCVARIGWLNRMTQFKEKAGKDRENASIGLYAYPCLMAADILAYHATHVPVGEDQKQHLELARDIAQKFNTDYFEQIKDITGKDEFFPQPEPLIQGPAPRVMSLRDGKKKMSKSDLSEYSRITLFDDADTIALKVKKAKTDPLPVPASLAELDNRPEAANLITIFSALSDKPKQNILNEYGGGAFSDFKAALIDVAIEHLEPISKHINALKTDEGELDKILSQGAEKASALAAPILAQTKEIMGLLKT